MVVVIDERCPHCGVVGLRLRGEHGAVANVEIVSCGACHAETTVTWAPLGVEAA